MKNIGPRRLVEVLMLLVTTYLHMEMIEKKFQISLTTIAFQSW